MKNKLFIGLMVGFLLLSMCGVALAEEEEADILGGWGELVSVIIGVVVLILMYRCKSQMGGLLSKSVLMFFLATLSFFLGVFIKASQEFIGFDEGLAELSFEVLVIAGFVIMLLAVKNLSKIIKS